MVTLYKTKGIAINYIKYGETSIIAKVFTKEFGLQTYIINGIRSKKPRISISYFQPLSLLNMVVYKRRNASIHRISEIECMSSASSIPVNIYKSGIALFVSEILSKCIKEEMEDPQLFDFIFRAIQTLDEQSQDFENFHLLFMLKLGSFLGFSPLSGTEILSQVYQHIDEKSVEEIRYFDEMINSEFTSAIKIGVQLRRQLLDDLIKFYQIHIDNLGMIRSMDVLREVMN